MNKSFVNVLFLRGSVYIAHYISRYLFYDDLPENLRLLYQEELKKITYLMGAVHLVILGCFFFFSFRWVPRSLGFNMKSI